MITESKPEILVARGYKKTSWSAYVFSVSPVREVYFVVKRFLDLIGSLILLLGLMSWLVPLVAILIKLDSRGPVFFVQQRVGKRGRLFPCFKFRSMVPNREADKKQALPGDQRITRTGRFLRKSNVDELPQLFNVLMGQMSFVGPRPHMPSDCRRFSKVVPDYESRCLVKPGITGMAQVKGFHGPSHNDDEIITRYQWDCFYVEQVGLKLDIIIVLRTVAQRLNFIWVSFAGLF